jgi:hypothetical protein
MKKSETKIVGWIKAEEFERDKLKALGVEGPMIYDPKTQVFEHCEVTDDLVLKNLQRNFKGFNILAFTIMTKINDKWHIADKQPYWRMVGTKCQKDWCYNESDSYSYKIISLMNRINNWFIKHFGDKLF